LPTADEWEVAASAAPALQRHYRYSWGETFDSRLANTQAGGQEDTQPVGSYHPAGNSPFGLMDMAGNVAEWTSTSALGERDGSNDDYAVKGGSFRDSPADVQTYVQQNVERHTTAEWLGFRCVADH
jgi:formylglycine-generating enzyme required for sulfatase activity